MKLLIVDDSAMIRRAITTAYKGSVFTDVQTAADGLLAMTVFKQQLPDVVTLDITMPYMDGLAALSQMLEIKPNTIVLVISALADNHTAIEALIRGAQQFIYKPFTSDDLKDALDTLLKDFDQPDDTLPIEDSKSKHSESVAQSEGFDKRISKVTQPAQTIPSATNYPSGFVQPPTRSNLNPNFADHTAVSRQMSIRSHLLNNNDSNKK